VTEVGGYRFFAGWRSDPFFFDTLGIERSAFTGDDFFVDKDVCSIVLKCLILPSEPNESGYGAHAGRRGRVWSRQTGVHYLHKRSFSWRGARWLPRGRAGERCPFSSSRLRACRWSTPGYTPEEARGWQKHCCRLLPYAPRPNRAPRLFRAMAVRSPTNAAVPFLAVLKTGGVTGDKWAHSDLLAAASPIWGRRYRNLCAEPRKLHLLATELPQGSRRPGST